MLLVSSQRGTWDVDDFTDGQSARRLHSRNRRKKKKFKFQIHLSILSTVTGSARYIFIFVRSIYNDFFRQKQRLGICEYGISIYKLHLVVKCAVSQFHFECSFYLSAECRCIQSVLSADCESHTFVKRARERENNNKFNNTIIIMDCDLATINMQRKDDSPFGAHSQLSVIILSTFISIIYF